MENEIVLAQVRATLKAHLMADDGAMEQIADGQDLLTTGVLDSFGYLDFIGALEEAFGMEIDIAKLDEARMVSIVGLASILYELRTLS